jgi:hypothetical protein
MDSQASSRLRRRRAGSSTARPRSLSLHSSAFKPRSLQHRPSSSCLIESLDLPLAWEGLRAFLFGCVSELEEGLDWLENAVSAGDDTDAFDDGDAEDDESDEAAEVRHEVEAANQSALSSFILQARAYLHSLKADLPLPDLPSLPRVDFDVGPLTDDLLASFEARFSQLHAIALDLRNSSPSNPFPSLSTLYAAVPSPPALDSYFSFSPVEKAADVKRRFRTYVAGESTRLRAFVRGESDKLKSYVQGESDKLRSFVHEESAKVKELIVDEAEKFSIALREGAKRLLHYDELPLEWRNNEFIVKGYRFIPIERWRELALSGFCWHNETRECAPSSLSRPRSFRC